MNPRRVREIRICAIAGALMIVGTAMAQEREAPQRDNQGRIIRRAPRGSVRETEKPAEAPRERGRITRDRDNAPPQRDVDGTPNPPTRERPAGSGTRTLRGRKDNAQQLPFRPDPRLRDRDFDRDSRRGIGRNTTRGESRRYVPPGTRVTQLPSSRRTVRFHDRDYYRVGDSFYLRETGPFGERYIVTRPPRGAYIRSLPVGASVVNVGGIRYYTFNDVYYLPSVTDSLLQYLVVDAPLGGFVTQLPGEYELVNRRGRRLYRVGNVYYRPEYRGSNLIYIRVPDFEPEPTLLYGTLSYRGRLALPGDASAYVRLLELESGDQARVVAEDRIVNAGQAPIPFRLRFDKEDRRATRYAIEAEISANGRTLFATTERFLLKGDRGAESVDLVLDSVRDRGPIPRARVSGTINFEARIAIPPRATVDVRLVDWNHPDGATVMAEETLPFRGGPIPFELRFDPSEIDPMGIYVVDAEIRVDGNAVLYNQESFRVLTRGHDDEVEVWLDPS